MKYRESSICRDDLVGEKDENHRLSRRKTMNIVAKPWNRRTRGDDVSLEKKKKKKKTALDASLSPKY